MNLRQYQKDAGNAFWAETREQGQRVLLSLPCGGGKTVIASNITHATITRPSRGHRVLVLAHTDELIDQAVARFSESVGIMPSVEKAEAYADLSAWCVVGSVQSIARENRLGRFPRGHFGLVIIDEAHRTLGDTYMRVVNHFADATLLGITATPYRGDRKPLAKVYDRIVYEISYRELVELGYLARIRVVQTGIEIDMSRVRDGGGDYNDEDLADAVAPVMRQVAKRIVEHAKERKGLVFLPTIKSSQQFSQICRDVGIDARHVDGKSVDRQAILAWYATPGPKLLSNCAVLLEGFDQPDIDMVMSLRATRSATLAAQIPGRGTRIFPGKDHLLLLDVKWKNPAAELVSPSQSFAGDEERARMLQDDLDGKSSGGEGVDLLDTLATVEESMAKALQEAALAAQGQTLVYDALSPADIVAADMGWDRVIGYEPILEGEKGPPTQRQLDSIEAMGIDGASVTCKGEASIILGENQRRIDAKLARLHDVREIMRRGLADPVTARSMGQAEAEAMREEYGWPVWGDTFDWNDIRRSAEPYMDEVCRWLLPEGFRRGKWWIGRPTDVKVDLATGCWWEMDEETSKWKRKTIFDLIFKLQDCGRNKGHAARRLRRWVKERKLMDLDQKTK